MIVYKLCYFKQHLTVEQLFLKELYSLFYTHLHINFTYFVLLFLFSKTKYMKAACFENPA